MTKDYFEDIELNVTHRSRSYLLEEKGIIEFAKEWNPEPYHIDPAVGKESKIGSIFAAGPHLIAISVKLTNEKRPRTACVAGLSWEELKFMNPGLPGDQLVVETEAISKRISESNPHYGIVKYAVRLVNQNDAHVLTYSVNVMVETKDVG